MTKANTTFLKSSMCLMVASTLMVGTAYAQSATSESAAPYSAAWYVGAAIGQSRARIDDDSISKALAADGSTSTTINNDDRSHGYKVFGGYQFNDYFAIEGGYVDLGKFGYQAVTNPAGTLNGRAEFKGVNLGVLGFLPFTEHLSAFGRVGMGYITARDNFNSSGIIQTTNPNPSQKSTNYNVGLGLQYQMTPALALRVEAERYRVGDAIGNKGDVDMYSVGLVYRFGQSAPVRPAPLPVAAPVAPPPPAPVVMAPPPPPPAPLPPRKVSLSADSLFEFNKANIKPEGKKAIDQFVADLKGADFSLITVSGHTDRIGSHKYNLDLSRRRAETVKSYLVSSAGIPADKIDAKGLDGDNPVTKPGECRGNKISKALIACLQPDRRVDLEVTGTVKQGN